MNAVAEPSDRHVDVACYVADALDPAERDAFEAHLVDCEQCRREVVEFSETAAELASLSALGPPPRIRTALLDLIETESGVVPAAASEPEVQPEVEPRVEPVTEPVDELAARRRSSGNRRLLIALAAAAVVLVLALGGVLVNLVQLQQANVAAQSAAQRQSALLGAPDARILTQTQGGASYSFLVSKERNEAMLMTANLPDPGAGKAYQLWTLQGRRATPDATMPAGTRSQWFTGAVADSTSLAVTVEPVGGSRQPTPPILSQVVI